MGNPDDERTTINVKGVSVRAWERAKASAIRQGQPMGVWLSRAIVQLADMEAGPREFPPANPSANLGAGTGNPGPAATMTAADLADLMRGMAAYAEATGVPQAKADVRRAYGLADELVRDARGIPRKPRPVGKTAGQSLLEKGKAVPLIEGKRRGKSAP